MSKINFLQILIFIAGLSPFTIHAEGGMASGGGKGLVCFSASETAKKVRSNRGVVDNTDLNKIVSINALDFIYSNNTLPTLSFFQNKGHTEVIEKILSRIEITIPFLYQNIIHTRKILEKGTRYRQNPLKPIDDENDVVASYGSKCALTTLALNFNLESGPQLHIDNRLFNHPKHTDISKAILLLHEYIYFQARLKGARDSQKTRELIRIILNGPSYTLDEFTKKVYSLGFIGKAPQVTYAPDGSISRNNFFTHYQFFSAPLRDLYNLASYYLRAFDRYSLSFDELNLYQKNDLFRLYDNISIKCELNKAYSITEMLSNFLQKDGVDDCHINFEKTLAGVEKYQRLKAAYIETKIKEEEFDWILNSSYFKYFYLPAETRADFMKISRNVFNWTIEKLSSPIETRTTVYHSLHNGRHSRTTKEEKSIYIPETFPNVFSSLEFQRGESEVFLIDKILKSYHAYGNINFLDIIYPSY